MGVSLISHPIAKGVGLVLQAPDMLFDVYDMFNKPSIKNGIHTGLDFGSQLRHIIPGKVDDVILQIPGAIDDGYNVVTDRDILEDSYNYGKRTLSPKSRYSIKNTTTTKRTNKPVNKQKLKR